MVRRRLLTDRQCWQVIGQMDAGQRQIDVTARFGISQCVVSRLYQRYRQTEKITERPGRGRKRATSVVDDRYVVNQALLYRTECSRLRQ